jgi:hypothetical protein
MDVTMVAQPTNAAKSWDPATGQKNRTTELLLAIKNLNYKPQTVS